MLKINGKEIVGTRYAYDMCHKFYIIEDEKDYEDARGLGYNVFDIENIELDWKTSCDLRFIENWKLDKTYVRQFEDAIFEWEK